MQNATIFHYFQVTHTIPVEINVYILEHNAMVPALLKARLILISILSQLCVLTRDPWKFRFHWDSSHTGLLPYDSSRGTPPDRDPSRPGSLPTGIPPDRDFSQTGLLPKRDSSRNVFPPETGLLLRRDSSRDRIPPETGFLPRQDSSRNGIPPKKKFPPGLGGILFWKESRFGRNPVLGGVPREGSRSGGVPREESCFLLCRKIQNESFRSGTRRWEQA